MNVQTFGLPILLIYARVYRYAEDEIEIGKIAHSIGFSHVSLSHDVMPMVKIVSRGYTASADAYLTPCIKKYTQV